MMGGPLERFAVADGLKRFYVAKNTQTILTPLTLPVVDIVIKIPAASVNPTASTSRHRPPQRPTLQGADRRCFSGDVRWQYYPGSRMGQISRERLLLHER